MTAETQRRGGLKTLCKILQILRQTVQGFQPYSAPLRLCGYICRTSEESCLIDNSHKL